MSTKTLKIDFNNLENYCILCETMKCERKRTNEIWGIFENKKVNKISSEQYKQFINMRKEFAKNGKQRTEWDGTEAGTLPVIITFTSKNGLEKTKHRFLITNNEREARELYGWNF